MQHATSRRTRPRGLALQARKRLLRQRLRSWSHRTGHRLVHRAEWFAHTTYLGFVSFEAHGNYKYAAGALLLLLVLGAFLGEEPGA